MNISQDTRTQFTNISELVFYVFANLEHFPFDYVDESLVVNVVIRAGSSFDGALFHFITAKAIRRSHFGIRLMPEE